MEEHVANFGDLGSHEKHLDVKLRALLAEKDKMGSWNQTCGITQLHITAGTPVAVVPLVENKSGDFIYSHDLWRPAPVLFYGEYDGYGGAIDCHGPAKDFIVSELGERLVEGRFVNAKKISREKFDLTVFFGACHETALCVPGWNGECNVGFMMIHGDVIQALFRDYQISDYHHREPYGLDDILSEIPEFIRRLRERTKSHGYFSHITNPLGPGDGSRRIDGWVETDGYDFGIVTPVDLMCYLEHATDEHAAEILGEHIRLTWINAFMAASRKAWMPQVGQGSQGVASAPYRFIARVINEILDREDAVNYD